MSGRQPASTRTDALLERLERAEREIAEVRRMLLARVPEMPRTSAVDWRVVSLGTFGLHCGDRVPDPCPSRRGRSILRFLLDRSDHAATADLLIETFWPLTAPASGAHNLQMAIYALRRSLRGCGPGGTDQTVLFGDGVYQLNPALVIDQDMHRFRAAFERGRRALAGHQPAVARAAFEEARRLYGGAYLADSPYEEWADAQRAALQDLQLSLLGHLSTAYASTGEWDAAAECAREILAVDPYREDACRQLMRCEAANGRMAEVQRTYEACSRRLRTELGVDPSPETVRLARELVRRSRD